MIFKIHILFLGLILTSCTVLMPQGKYIPGINTLKSDCRTLIKESSDKGFHNGTYFVEGLKPKNARRLVRHFDSFQRYNVNLLNSLFSDNIDAAQDVVELMKKRAGLLDNSVGLKEVEFEIARNICSVGLGLGLKVNGKIVEINYK